MTLAIGAKYPWGELNKLVTPTTKLPNAIILASDSRWTDKSGPVPYYEDVGTKLFPIDSRTGAVYAGGAEIGERCLNELIWQLPRQKRLGSQPIRELAQKTFRRVYKTYLASKKWLPDKCPLNILIGNCDTSGEAELCLFEYKDNFVAKPLNATKALGWSNTVEKFQSLLNNKLKEEVEKELSLRCSYPTMPIAALPISPHHVAIFIAASLNSIVESEFDKTVGGKIQCAVITAEGFSLPEFRYTTDPTNEGPGFTKVTPEPHELKTVTGIFGCYDL